MKIVKTSPEWILAAALMGLESERTKVELRIRQVKELMGQKVTPASTGPVLVKKKGTIRKLSESAEMMKAAKTFLSRNKRGKKVPQKELKNRATGFAQKWGGRTDLIDALASADRKKFDLASSVALKILNARPKATKPDIAKENAA